MKQTERDFEGYSSLLEKSSGKQKNSKSLIVTIYVLYKHQTQAKPVWISSLFQQCSNPT
jgi:hypothetical protein